MCSKCPIYSYWLSPISLCLYRIRSFIVVGPFKNATIDFIIIIVNTLFLYNIITMPYFVASDELTLATFMFEPETFRPNLLFIMLFTCKISAKQYEFAQYQCTYNTGYLVYKRPIVNCTFDMYHVNLLSHTCLGSLYLNYALG